MMGDDSNYTYYKKEELEEINEDVENFVMFKQEKLNLKELKFIKDIGMTREVATQIDFNMRKKLEMAFPELREFNILCFKAKNSTVRRAMIFPMENNYSHFFDTMKKFLNKHDSQENAMLKSRVKIKFKGKYVLQIEDDTYRNFMEKIKATIAKFKLTFKIKILLKKRLIEIESNHEKVKDMRDCMKELMGFLFPKPCQLKEESKKFDSFGLRSRAGGDYIDRLNNKFSGKAFGSYDLRSNRFLLRSDPAIREDYINRLEIWIGQFNYRVKNFEYKLKTRKEYFKNKAKTKEIAGRYDSQIQYMQKNKSLMVYYHEHIKEEDRMQPSMMTKLKQQDMESLRAQFDSIFHQSDPNEQSHSTHLKASKDSKESRIL